MLARSTKCQKSPEFSTSVGEVLGIGLPELGAGAPEVGVDRHAPDDVRPIWVPGYSTGRPIGDLQRQDGGVQRPTPAVRNQRREILVDRSRFAVNGDEITANTG
jgi:hypothetical protein